MSLRRGESIGGWLLRMERRAERLENSNTVVYRAFDSYGLLLYIGCTVNLKSRMAAHRSGLWHRFAETIATVEYPSRSTALAAEKAAIDSEASYFNSTQADINRTQANKNAARQALWRQGWYCPDIAVDLNDEDAWEAAWAAIEGEYDAWHRALHREEWRLKGGAFPFMTDADRLARYRAARENAEVARQEMAA